MKILHTYFQESNYKIPELHFLISLFLILSLFLHFFRFNESIPYLAALRL